MRRKTVEPTTGAESNLRQASKGGRHPGDQILRLEARDHDADVERADGEEARRPDGSFREAFGTPDDEGQPDEEHESAQKHRGIIRRVDAASHHV